MLLVYLSIAYSLLCVFEIKGTGRRQIKCIAAVIIWFFFNPFMKVVGIAKIIAFAELNRLPLSSPFPERLQLEHFLFEDLINAKLCAKRLFCFSHLSHGTTRVQTRK